MSRNATPARILIVEDEAIVATDIETSLRELGYQISGKAATGEAALELAFSTKPDLVLMDIILDGAMRGTDAAKVLREQFNLPVVFLTGNSDAPTLRSALGTTPYGYILKPFEERELHIAIEIALDKHEADLQCESLIVKLEAALRQVKVLQDMVPVCGWCRKVRDDDGFWKTVENYVSSRFQVDITHGICPECYANALHDLNRKGSAGSLKPVKSTP